MLLVGAGGINGEIATGLARKGYGTLRICDHDVVELSNLNRQHFFQADLYQPKALSLARNAARQGYLGTGCIGHFTSFDEHSADVLATSADVAVVGVDNNRARRFASVLCRARRIPVVFAAVNEASDFGTCFVQEADGPCLACVFPRIASAASHQPCRESPAGIDILKMIGGAVLRAVDSLVMAQPRGWNLRELSLSGPTGDAMYTVQARPDCPLCAK